MDHKQKRKSKDTCTSPCHEAKENRNRRRREIDYVNVQFARNQGGKRYLKSIGDTPRALSGSDRSVSSTVSSQRFPESVTESDRSASALSSSTDSIDGRIEERSHRGMHPTQKARYTSKTKQVRYRATRTDSESSSASGVTESADLLEAKAREIEHYNRLKLNLNRLTQSEEVRKGVRVLYAHAINGEVSSTNCIQQRVVEQQHPTQPKSQVQIKIDLVESLGSSHEESTKAHGRMKKEGHMNRLHSVTGRPVTRSQSILWKRTLPKSFSTGDVHKIMEEGVHGETNDSKHVKQRAKRSHSCSEVKSSKTNDHLSKKKLAEAAKMAVRKRAAKQRERATYENTSDSYHQLRFTRSETPKQPIRQRNEFSSERMSSRSKAEHARQKHSVLQKSPTTSLEVPSHRTLQSSSMEANFSNSYESTHSDRKVNLLSPPLTRPGSLHNNACPITCTCKGIHFIDPMVTIPCDNSGGEYISTTHDFKIVIPKGAIKKRATVEVQVGVTMHGPFHFPPNKRAVSPIIWLGVWPEVKLKKPIEVTLPHFLDLHTCSEKDKAPKNTIFLRASEKTNQASSRARFSTARYTFKATENEELFDAHDGYSTILTKQLSFYCIATSIEQEPRIPALYCLLPVIPKSIQQNTWKIHYCVTYLLKSCIQLVQRQFGSEWEILAPRTFKFSELNSMPDHRMHKRPRERGTLEIQFERQLKDTGWILALESNNRIHASDIDLWGSDEGRLDVMESISLHPPRFTIRVHGEDARMSSMSLFSFVGACEELSSEIVLPLRSGYRASENNSTPLSTPTSSVFSPQHISVGSSQDSTFMTTPITATAPPCITKDAWQYHSTLCTCEECVGADYDHLPSLEELGQTHVQLTYHNGHIDMPTDEDLRNVATRVSECIHEDWPVLQTALNVPDHIMLDVLSQRTIVLQVYRLLKEWRNHAKDCSKEKLAECLLTADKRLEIVSNDLQSNQ